MLRIGELVEIFRARYRARKPEKLQYKFSGEEAFYDVLQKYRVQEDYFLSENYMELNERADYTAADHDLMVFTGKLIKALRARGLPFYVHTCWRSPALQETLMRQGKSGLKSGAHQKSAAVDLVHCHYHWNLPDQVWFYVGLLGREIIKREGLKITWGGDWDGDNIPVLKDRDERFWDPAHWQVKHWRKLADVPSHGRKKANMTPTYIAKTFRAKSRK